MKNLLTIFTILLISATWSCRTSSRNVSKEKASIDSSFYQKKEIELKNDSAYFELKEINTTKSLLSLLSDLNVNYNGLNDDSLVISILETTQGIDIKFKGKGAADFKSSNQKKSESENSTSAEIAQVQQTKSEQSEISEQLKIDKSKTEKESKQKTSGLQWNFAIIIAMGLIVLIACYFLYRYLKSLNIFSKK